LREIIDRLDLSTPGVASPIFNADWQPPRQLTRGRKHQNLVYFLSAGIGEPIKIGFSSDFRRRLIDLQSTIPYPLTVLALMRGGCETESFWHRTLSTSCVRGEWFAPTEEVAAAIQCARERTRDYLKRSPDEGVLLEHWKRCLLDLRRRSLAATMPRFEYSGVLLPFGS
jgi:hypothetical protein